MSPRGKKKGLKKAQKIRKKTASRSDLEDKELVRTKMHKHIDDGLCLFCKSPLPNESMGLFVEEENGRVFCSEDCITGYFTPEIENLEKEYFLHLTKDDISPAEADKHSHLRWETLKYPKEVWREKNSGGDYRYTFIAQFELESQKMIWFICMTLCLRGEPSFLFLAFPTRNPAMLEVYRRGEKLDWIINPPSAESNSHKNEEIQTDRLADDWTVGETWRADLAKSRKPDDIPKEEFDQYVQYLEDTISNHEEVWSLELNQNAVKNEVTKFFNFIKFFPNHDPPFWYIVITRELDEGEQLEILDAFPTKDPDLVAKYRADGETLFNLNADNSDPDRMIH